MPEPVFWGTADGAKAWDTILISGQAAPGIAKVTGKGFAQKLDMKKVKGSGSYILRFEGQDAAEFTVLLRVWTQQQLTDLYALIRRIKPKKGEAPTAFDVVHPALDFFDIRQMYVKDAPLPSEGEKGIYEVSLSCMEFLPLSAGGKSKNKTTKPTFDIPSLDNPVAEGGPSVFANAGTKGFAKAASEIYAPSKDPSKTKP